MTIVTAIMYYASVYALDPALVLAIAKTESQLNTFAVGSHGEIGLMQVLPKYSKVSVGDLFSPEKNIAEGARKLAEARDRCAHKKDNTWVICFNLGVAGGSRIKYPKQFEYYRRVMNNLKLSECIGREVMVEKLHGNVTDGRAILVKKAPPECGQPRWYVEVYGMVIPVNETRILKVEAL